MIQFTVLGSPAPKGSSRAILRGGYAVNVPSGSDKNKERMKTWDANVREAAAAAVGNVSAPPFVMTPLALSIVFRMRRPAGHYNKKGALHAWAVYARPLKKPDVSKLVRATEDVLSGIVYDDDARVVRLVVEKVYAAPGQEGAVIRVEEVFPKGIGG